MTASIGTIYRPGTHIEWDLRDKVGNLLKVLTGVVVGSGMDGLTVHTPEGKLVNVVVKGARIAPVSAHTQHLADAHSDLSTGTDQKPSDGAVYQEAGRRLNAGRQGEALRRAEQS